MYTIKRLLPFQASLVSDHFKRLDEQSIYDRFCTAANVDFINRYTLQIDFSNSGIFGIFDDNVELIGVGECVVNKNNTSDAEVAFSIELSHQGKGLGNRLMKKLIQFAKANHIENLNMYCMRNNKKSLHLAKKYGINLTHERDEVYAKIGLPQTTVYVQQSYELVDELVASLEIVQKNNLKLFKYNYLNFFLNPLKKQKTI